MSCRPVPASRFVDHVIAVCVVVCVTLPAAALPSGHVSVLYDLGSDDFTVRRRATEQLLADEQLDEEKIAQLYAKAHLPEQRHRLLAVARHHAVGQMRRQMFDDKGIAAIGVRHTAFSAGQFPELEQAGLIVVETFPGFPGHVYLRRGDVILQIDGRRFPADLSADKTAQLFVHLVQEHQAGELASLVVQRDGRMVTIQLQLASLNALRAMYKDAQNLQQPFLAKWLSVRQKLVGQQGQEPTLRVQSPPDSNGAD